LEPLYNHMNVVNIGGKKKRKEKKRKTCSTLDLCLLTLWFYDYFGSYDCHMYAKYLILV
jgi:hypothetical protein